MAHSIALENTVKEMCEGLRSSRVTDRKKNGEKLKDFLNMTAVPALLTENTLKKRGYSWNDLFDDIIDYTLKVIHIQLMPYATRCDCYRFIILYQSSPLVCIYFAYEHNIFFHKNLILFSPSINHLIT